MLLNAWLQGAVMPKAADIEALLVKLHAEFRDLAEKGKIEDSGANCTISLADGSRVLYYGGECM